jgi:hypothetical protein
MCNIYLFESACLTQCDDLGLHPFPWVVEGVNLTKEYMHVEKKHHETPLYNSFALMPLGTGHPTCRSAPPLTHSVLHLPNDQSSSYWSDCRQISMLSQDLCLCVCVRMITVVQPRQAENGEMNPNPDLHTFTRRSIFLVTLRLDYYNGGNWSSFSKGSWASKI